MVEGHVIIDIDAMGLPVAVLIALHRQGAQHRFVEPFKQAAAAAFAFAEGSLIESNQQFRNGLVEFGQSAKLALPHCRQNPALDQ